MLNRLAFYGSILAALASSPAWADVIVNYTYSSDATMLLMDGSTEYISGGFVWNTTNSTLVSSNTSLTGSDLTETFTGNHSGLVREFSQSSNQGITYLQFDVLGAGFEIQFMNELSLAQTDPIYLVEGPPAYYPGIWVANNWIQAVSFTGSAEVAPTGAPEPLSTAVLGVGMVGLGVLRRRTKARMQRPCD